MRIIYFIRLINKMAGHFDGGLKPSFLELIRSNLVRIAQLGEFGVLAQGALEASKITELDFAIAAK
jgi:hypothetical protein